MMREFLVSSKKFFEDVKTLDSYTKSFEHLNSRLNNSILNEKDEKSIHNQIEVVNKRFKSLSYSLNEKINVSTDQIEQMENKNDNFEYKTLKIHLHAQTKALTEAVNKYRDAQFKHKAEEEEKFKLQYIIAKPGADEDEINESISGDQSDAKLASAFALGSNSAQGILEEAEKRKTNIKKIGEMIQELIEMMRILNEAISKQTDVVDKIAENLITAEENTAAANVDLTQALDYQIRATRIKRIIGTCIVVVVIIAILYVILKLNIFGTKRDE
ncbi:Syntaxin-like protein psy1 [Nosema bombycis CQ1]|uniref:Syntaxin-like protein psy1 n=1 Tax=Nosema bombycis (strain CQ1 / CVCC 102059) TaxID=578461 RepID=R0KMH7_NOSB1|nr:Syntaxin-like protein psy1 [Nosema bombycis CQ1]|eukprot:EOB11856.1 Syntaxin-like protein psy1 [Nosema bombycis CQ1]